MTKDGKNIKEVEVEQAQPKLSDAQIKQYKKQQAMQLSNYKRELASNVEIKRLQVEELELNVKYYHAKMAWRELQSKVEELEAKEKAEIAEMREKRQKEMEELRKEKEAEKKPEKKIEVVTQGKPRK